MNLTMTSALTNLSNAYTRVLPACGNLTDLACSSASFEFDLGARCNGSDTVELLRRNGESFVPINFTCPEHAPRLTSNMYLKAVVLAVISVLSLIANLSTIYSVARNRRRHHNWSAIYALILHLSVADLLVTICCIAGDAVWSYTVAWIWGNAACKIFKFLQVFSLYLSTFVLVLIGVDRFIVVRYPMKSLNTAHRCTRLIIVAWILSAILAAPQIVIFHVSRGPFIEEFNQCVTHGFYTEAWQEQLYAAFSTFFMFLLPLIILVTTYVSTVITIAQNERLFKSELSNDSHLIRVNSDINRRRLMNRAKAKSLRISVVIVAAFVLWWTPYYTMMIILMFLNPDKHLSKDLQNGIFFFGMSNSLMNPLIYGAFHLWPQKQRHKFNHRDSSMLRHRSMSTNASNSVRELQEARVPFMSRVTTNFVNRDQRKKHEERRI